MSARDDGGPAFPVIGADGAGEDYGGMTLRDYFAAKALPACVVACKGDTHEGEEIEVYFARKSYAIADAMVAERAK